MILSKGLDLEQRKLFRLIKYLKATPRVLFSQILKTTLRTYIGRLAFTY